MPETVHDRWGHAIYLTEERWEHILEFHEEMADCRDELFTTLIRGRRKQEALDPSVYLYYHPFDYLPGDNTHVIVVVKFTTRMEGNRTLPNHFVLTAYLKALFSQR